MFRSYFAVLEPRIHGRALDIMHYALILEILMLSHSIFQKESVGSVKSNEIAPYVLIFVYPLRVRCVHIHTETFFFLCFLCRYELLLLSQKIYHKSMHINI